MSMLLSVLVTSAVAGIASAPHCAMMCGPLAFSVCGTSQGAGLRYGVGRFIAYALTGSVAGALGAAATRTLRTIWLQRTVSLLVAMGILLAALRPWRMSCRSDTLVKLRASRAAPTLRPWLTGLATGVLPCGSLLAGLAIAAGAASPWGGALAMVIFATASAPGLLAAVFLGEAARRGVGSGRWPGAAKCLAAVMVAAATWVAARPWVTPEHACTCSRVHASISQGDMR